MTNDGTMAEGRRTDAERRRQRVLKVIDSAARSGEEITVSGIARAAGVDRSFLYRHRDLLHHLHAAASTPATSADGQERVSRASLQADLANALDQNRRLATRVQQLEKRLSQLLGEQAWRDSGLGAAADLDQLQRHAAALEQRMVDLQGQLDERTEELQAARAANRELTRTLNQTPR